MSFPLPLGEGQGEGEAFSGRTLKRRPCRGASLRHDSRSVMHPHPSPLPKGEGEFKLYWTRCMTAASRSHAGVRSRRCCNKAQFRMPHSSNHGRSFQNSESTRNVDRKQGVGLRSSLECGRIRDTRFHARASGARTTSSSEARSSRCSIALGASTCPSGRRLTRVLAGGLVTSVAGHPCDSQPHEP